MATLSKTASHAAPGPYLGFALQPVRLCLHLLQGEHGDSVSIESLDDISIIRSDGTAVLEQCKSALSQNPISDRAVDLWKCLANWLKLTGEGLDPEKAEFRLYVTPNKSGKLVKLMNAAVTEPDVNDILTAAEPLMKQTSKGLRPACAPYYDLVLQADPAARSAVIRNMSVESDADPVDPIRDLLKYAVEPSMVDLLCEFAIGMAKERADRLLRRGTEAALDAMEFRQEFTAVVRKHNVPGMLVATSPRPPADVVGALVDAAPTFVRQLDLIGATAAERMRAASDFLRTSAERTSWAEAGFVLGDALDEWDDDLVWRHELICNELSHTHSSTNPNVRGGLVYRRCAQLDTSLDGRVVPQFFTHGSFNILADVMRLGWHPDYLSLLGPT